MEELYGMIIKNANSKNITSDLDLLLNFTSDSNISWTAPKWLTEGDILFFYHAVTAKKRVAKLLKQAKVDNNIDIITFLEHSKKLAERYSGTVFGYAIVTGQPEFIDDDENENWHFKGKVFAPLKDFHLFNHPINAKDFSTFLLISRQSSITYLAKEQFNNLRDLFLNSNALPNYLKNAEFSELGLKNITKDNWLSIACSSNIRFSLEGQLRAYFLDYFLNELKDKGTVLMEECHCRRNNINTGFSDYFIKLHGQWIPVEAKLNIKAEKNLFCQIAKYTHIDSFVPTKGNSIGKSILSQDNKFCLIADQNGIYLVYESKFYKCNENTPFVKRSDINHNSIILIRDEIKSIISS